MIKTLSPEGFKCQAHLTEKFPDLTPSWMEIADYFTGNVTNIDHKKVVLKGHLVEAKYDDFNVQQNKTLDQFRDELYRMVIFREKNPHVVLHAYLFRPTIWENPFQVKDDGTVINIVRLFVSMCAEYDVWPHIFTEKDELFAFLEKLDHPSQFQKHTPFMMRAHDVPTLMARIWRQFVGINSQRAIDLSKIKSLSSFDQIFQNAQLTFEAECDLDNYYGDNINNEPTKLFLDTKKKLEN